MYSILYFCKNGQFNFVRSNFFFHYSIDRLTQTSFVTDCKLPNDLTDDGGPLFGFTHADDDDDDVRSE